MKKISLLLVTLLTAMTAGAGEYTFDSETGTLTLVSGEFNKDNKWSVSSSSVTSVIATNQVSFTGDCTELFSGFNNCTSMDLNSVNTSTVTNMNSMFSGCVALTTLDLSSWNTSNVTDMSFMFLTCTQISSLNISSWNTANVTNMNSMFNSCGSGTASLDLSGWDTGNVTSMSLMFDICGFASLNLSGWNMGKVVNMTSMFGGSSNLTSVDLSGWNNLKVLTMTSMFLSCYSLKTVNLTGWDISNTVSIMSAMFSGCSNLTTIYASRSWDAGNVNANSTAHMFDNCTSLVGGMGTTFDSNYTDKTYARIDRGAEQPGYFTGVFTLTLPANVTASPNPVCTLGGARYFKAGSTVTLSYSGTVPQGKKVVYSVNGTPVEGNSFQMPLDDVTVTVSFRDLPTEIAVGDITFNMIKVDGNNDISTFYIGECEVTEALWQAVMGSNPSSNPGNLQDNLPVENISWNDCQEFLAKLRQMTNLDFRLPTSAEWLFAASGGNDTHGYTYSGSNTVDDVAWYASNCEQKQPVGTKAPNELGIHDMSGNVYEIIQEATGAYGGGWHAPAKNCKVNFGWPIDEDYTDNDTGFRLAITNFFEIPETVTVGDITFNMVRVKGNDEISTFYIGECEVTEALWHEVMGSNPSSSQGNLEDNLPVESVSWNDCQEFLAKLRQKTRLDFRLPTSAEWVFAASGGNDTYGYTYSGSNTIDDVAWYASNCEQKQPVGTKAPNELGIHDMSGNVYEIIQEATGAYGGGWHSPAKNCKVNYYWPADEDYTDNDTGFRLALTNFYEIQTVTGDVNGDGNVTIADVTAIYKLILYNDDSAIVNGDQNGDGNITVADATVIYNILLGNKK